MTEKKSGVRQANFELLRVVAMLMVLTNHALGHGGVLEQYAFNTVPYMLFWFLDGLCYVAVDVFVLITGYFMVNAPVKLSRIIRLILQVEAFSILSFAFSTFVFKTDVTTTSLLLSFFPLTSSSYWFASQYMVLLALMPLLNRFIHALDRKDYRASMILLLIVFSVIPSFAFWSREKLFSGFSFVWFIVLYLAGGYIRLCCSEPSEYKMTPLRWFGLYLGLTAVGGVCRSVIGIVSLHFFESPKGEGIFRAYNSIVIFAAALCLFMAFKEMKIRSALLIRFSRMGIYCFGAYLATDHELLRVPLWNAVRLFDVCQYGVWNTLISTMITVISLFLIGCGLEFIRASIMGRTGVKKWVVSIDTFLNTQLRRANYE